jgi:hypothetical protein
MSAAIHRSPDSSLSTPAANFAICAPARSTFRAPAACPATRCPAPGHGPGAMDMVRANRMGLTVIDASQAMEGNGPSAGDLVDMGLIIAGTDPLATDMVGAATMGIAPAEVPTVAAAWATGMALTRLEDIEVRGAPVEVVRRRFKRPNIIPWSAIAHTWGVQELKSPLPPGPTSQRMPSIHLL